MSYFYAMRHKITGKIYVGCTCSYSTRIAQHMGDLRRGKHPNKILQADCNKHGVDFDYYLLEEDDYENPFYREKEWQTLLKSNDPRYGYNVLADEDTGFHVSIEDFPKITKEGDARYKVEERNADRLYSRISSICKEKGIDLSSVCKRLGVTDTEVRNLMLFNGALRFWTMSDIAHAIGVGVADITEVLR